VLHRLATQQLFGKKRSFLSCACLAICLFAAATPVHAQANPSAFVLAQQCRMQPNWLPSTDNTTDVEDTEWMEVSADFAELTGDRFARFAGNVELRQSNQWLLTENADVDQWTGTLRAYNGIRYSDGFIAFRAEEIEANTTNASLRVGESEYVLLNSSAYGSAGSIQISALEGQQGVNLGASTFTTCPGERPAWEIRAASISMNEQESWGTAKHAQFRIFDVPVLYIPRFTFPLTEERKSGLLYPTIRSSARNGIELEAPWYFNIAPDRDATLTPRFMTRRGLMLMGEYRQLTPEHEFEIQGEYLSRDREIVDRPNRHFFRVENATQFNERWSGYVEFMQVSDNSYINDFTSAFANRADPHLYRRGQVDYRHENRHVQIQMEDFQMLGPYTRPYQTLPRVSLWQDGPINRLLDYSVFSEFTHFRNADDSSDYTTRIHFEPTMSLQLQRPGWDWQTELGMLVTHYEQQQGSVSRILPQVRTNARLHLERSIEGSGRLQTLTPQIQYLYVPYRNQSNIGIYDTILIQDDYYGLFRPRRFTGLDRIADAHQITLGASTSLFDQGAEELLRFSLGQIFYLDESQTQLFDESSRITASNSELSAELDLRVSEQWFVSSAVQYDTTLQLARKARVAVEYRKDADNLVQFNYRRVRGLTGTDQQVEQAGVLATWRLSADWALASHLYQDIRRGSTMDALLGLQYESCCWSIRLSAYRRINRNYELTVPNGALAEAEFDNGVSVQFMLTGLGGAAAKLTDILQQGIFGYRRPFYLSN